MKSLTVDFLEATTWSSINDWGRQGRRGGGPQQWGVAPPCQPGENRLSPRREVWMRQADPPSTRFLLPLTSSMLYNPIFRCAPGKSPLCSMQGCPFPSSQTKEFRILLTCANPKGLCISYLLKNNFDYSFLKLEFLELSFTIQAYEHWFLRICSNWP